MCVLLIFNDNVFSVEDNVTDVENTGSNIWNYYNIDDAQSKRGGTKNIRCIFCDTSLTEGSNVLAQKKANVGACVLICKKDNNRYVEFKIVQKVLNIEMMAKERMLSARNESQAKNLLCIQ